MRKITQNIVLVVILLVAIYFRFTGASPGYPPYHSDEGISYSAAVSMIRSDTMDPLRYDYPSIVPTINYISFKTIFIPFRWMKYYVTHAGDFLDGLIEFPLDKTTYKRVFQDDILGAREVNALFWGRYTTAFVGVMVVYLLYRVGSELYDVTTGLTSALLLSVNYRHVLNSHLGLPDIYNAFFLLLALLMAIRLWKHPNSKSYLLASVSAGLSLSTKYQFFSFFPLLVAHLFISYEPKTIKEKLKTLFRKEALVVVFVIMFVFILLNPYMFVKIEETVDWLVFVASKYRTHKYSLDYYPISYLYHFGIGKITSITLVCGIVVALIKDFRKTLFPFSSIAAFFYVTVYMTGGGFYTRNFVTIIPLLILFAGYLVAKGIGSKNIFIKIVLSVVLIYCLFENVQKSVVVAEEYTKTWNVDIIRNWIKESIPDESIVAAHSSVPLKPTLTRVPFEQRSDFSIQEFMQKDADFAVMNLDWVTNDFYWWMTRDTKTSLLYWEKPLHLLEESYPALIIDEFRDYSIFTVENPGLAPDSDFVVARIPSIESTRLNLMIDHEFDNSVEIAFGSWSSEVIDVKNISGLEIQFSAVYKGSGVRDGFVFVEYYDNELDANSRVNRKAVRVSPRVSSGDNYVFIHQVPEGTRYARVRIGVYDESHAGVYFDRIKVYSADVKENFGDWNLMRSNLDVDAIYPNSHGNL